MVHAMDAFKSPMDAEWSTNAKISVLTYIVISNTAPRSARVRLKCFMSESFLCGWELYWLCSRWLPFLLSIIHRIC